MVPVGIPSPPSPSLPCSTTPDDCSTCVAAATLAWGSAWDQPCVFTMCVCVCCPAIRRQLTARRRDSLLLHRSADEEALLRQTERHEGGKGGWKRNGRRWGGKRRWIERDGVFDKNTGQPACLPACVCGPRTECRAVVLSLLSMMYVRVVCLGEGDGRGNVGRMGVCCCV